LGNLNFLEKLLKGMTLFMLGDLDYMFERLDVKGFHIADEFWW
jgi:hypothetical protein